MKRNAPSCDPAGQGQLNNTGWMHHEAGRCEQALDMFQKALREPTVASRAEQIRIALVDRTRATVARALRDGAGHPLAYAELSQEAWLVESEPQRIERLKAQGNVTSDE